MGAVSYNAENNQSLGPSLTLEEPPHARFMQSHVIGTLILRPPSHLSHTHPSEPGKNNCVATQQHRKATTTATATDSPIVFAVKVSDLHNMQ